MRYKSITAMYTLFALFVGAAIASAAGIQGAGSFLFSFGEVTLEQKEARQQAVSIHKYDPSQGEILKIIDMKTVPEEIRPGQAAKIEITYLLISPAERNDRIKGNLVIRWEREMMGRAEIHNNTGNGTYVMAVPLYFYPKGYNARYGGYEIVMELESGALRDRGETVLKINEI